MNTGIQGPDTANLDAPETTTYYEWGYRLSDGSECWASDYGTDGAWISWNPSHHINVIDIYDGSEAASIYRELDRSGVAGVAIRRLVTETRSPAEDVTRVLR